MNRIDAILNELYIAANKLSLNIAEGSDLQGRRTKSFHYSDLYRMYSVMQSDTDMCSRIDEYDICLFILDDIQKSFSEYFGRSVLNTGNRELLIKLKHDIFRFITDNDLECIFLNEEIDFEGGSYFLNEDGIKSKGKSLVEPLSNIMKHIDYFLNKPIKTQGAELPGQVIDLLEDLVKENLRYFIIKPEIGSPLLTKSVDLDYLINSTVQLIKGELNLANLRKISPHTNAEAYIFYGFCKIKEILKSDKVFSEHGLDKKLAFDSFRPFIRNILNVKSSDSTIRSALSPSRYNYGICETIEKMLKKNEFLKPDTPAY